MRIAYLSFSRVPSRTANSVHVMRMAEALARAGHDVDLFAVGSGPAVAEDYEHYGVERSFRLVRRPVPPVPVLGAAAFGALVARAVRGGPAPDLLYARHLYSATAAVRVGAPLVFEAHAPPSYIWEARLLGRLFRHRAFARLVVISEALRGYYLGTYPQLARERVIVAHDAAPLPRGPTVATTAAHAPTDGAPFRVGYVGHLYDGRGIEIIVELARRFPDVQFDVVGGMPDDLARWRARAQLDNLDWRGFVPHAEVPRCYAACDVVLAPYQRSVFVGPGGGETSRWMSPLKIFEYMASGRAMICSDLPVLRETLRHESNALLVPPDDADAWAAALVRLRADDALRARIGTAAREDVEREHNWDARARRVLDGLASAAPARS